MTITTFLFLPYRVVNPLLCHGDDPVPREHRVGGRGHVTEPDTSTGSPVHTRGVHLPLVLHVLLQVGEVDGLVPVGRVLGVAKDIGHLIQAKNCNVMLGSPVSKR